MADAFRVRGGVIRPIRISDVNGVASDHLLIVSRSGDRANTYGQICDCEKLSQNGFRRLSTMTVRQRSGVATILTDLAACRHFTRILIEVHSDTAIDDPTEQKADIDDVINSAKRIMADCSRADKVSEFCDRYSSWMHEDLQINLNEVLRGPYTAALAWKPGSSDVSILDQLQPLLSARSSLVDVEAVAVTNVTDPRVVSTVRLAGQKVEAALLGLTAWQTAILESTAQELARVAARSERRERSHDRRIADLGAVTLFPMLLFAFLGANILPGVKFSADLPGVPVLIGSVIVGIIIAISGRSWVRRVTQREDIG